MRRRLALAGLLVLVAFQGAPLSASAQALGEVERAREAHAFARTVMSPFCPGRTLTDCPSPDAAALREEIRLQLDSGVSKEAIRQELERRFGPVVVAEPRAAWAWILPLAILGFGAIALVAALRSLSRARERGPEPDPELARRLDAEIDSRGL